MRLIDLLQTCSDSTNVSVVDLEENQVCCYDGKDSIDEEYNEWYVVELRATGYNWITVKITIA